jgi:hypothetical protein
MSVQSRKSLRLAVFGALLFTVFLSLGWALPKIHTMSKVAFRRFSLGMIQDIDLVRHRKAAEESSEYVDRHMSTAAMHPDKFSLLKASLDSVDRARKGIYCEFGVYKGATINFIASQVREEIHGFDSFEGLPEDWRSGYGKGWFKMTGLPSVASNVRLHKGWFQDSLPVFKKDHAGPIAFAHLDADLYSSTKTVFDILGDRIVPGTVLQFDEFFNYPGWKYGECLAFQELAAARGIEVEYIGYVPTSEQVAMRVKKTSSATK